MRLNKHLIILNILVALFSETSTAQSVAPNSESSLLVNAIGRDGISLNGNWNVIIDPMETGYYDYRREENPNGYFKNRKPENKTELIEYDFDTAPTLHVPGDWNSQKIELVWYEGTIWYKKSFQYDLIEGQRAFLYFEGVNYEAVVYLNGEKLGEHVGGFTPFNFEITETIQSGENFVVVKVNNTRKLEAVPTINSDWWNYGGITRSVKVVTTSTVFICDYLIQLEQNNPGKFSGYVKLDGCTKPTSIHIDIPELNYSNDFLSDADGNTIIEFNENPTLWSPENPKLYKVVITAGEDKITDNIGFRTIETKGDDILLNGKSIFLKGVCIHEEAPFRGGRAFGTADARTLLGWAKEMGCNYVRLSHYPHNEHMVKEAEKMGILIWEEIPLYWTIQWDNQSVYENAVQQFNEAYNRDKNRAAIILWSIANETPLSDSRLKFLSELAQYVKSVDSTRLVTAALEIHMEENDPSTVIINDPLGNYLDVIGCNEYFGWYRGLPDISAGLKWKSVFNKPLIMSEFGASAVYGKHGANTDRWTEEFQSYFYRENLKMLKKITFLKGTSPWLLMDFRSPKRPMSGTQDYYNRKGLISNKGERKQAFFIVKDFYHNLEE